MKNKADDYDHDPGTTFMNHCALGNKENNVNEKKNQASNIKTDSKKYEKRSYNYSDTYFEVASLVECAWGPKYCYFPFEQITVVQ